MDITEFMDTYIETYSKRIDYYKKLENYCYQLCQRQMDENGIRCIVSSRVKPVSSLKDKIIYRNKIVGFECIEDIHDDIRDKVGVRIALYFPPDSLEVEKIIYSLFEIVEEPARFEKNSLEYDPRFSGYRAWHYKVRLKSKAFLGEEYDGEVIEIQVASMLMHAWAEVEHDLAYKEPDGGISDLEYALLSQLNGLVHTGEVILEQLKIAMEKRIEDNNREFLNHYELASFIYKNIPHETKMNISQPTLGRVDILFNLLKSLNKHYPKAVLNYLASIENDTSCHAISYRIIEKILAESERAYSIYFDIISQIKEPLIGSYSEDFEKKYRDNENEINVFLLKWVALENYIREDINDKNFDIRKISSMLQEMLGEGIVIHVLDVYKMRTRIVHGIEVPEKKELREAINNIDKVLKEIEKLENRSDYSRKIV